MDDHDKLIKEQGEKATKMQIEFQLLVFNLMGNNLQVNEKDMIQTMTMFADRNARELLTLGFDFINANF